MTQPTHDPDHPDRDPQEDTTANHPSTVQTPPAAVHTDLEPGRRHLHAVDTPPEGITPPSDTTPGTAPAWGTPDTPPQTSPETPEKNAGTDAPGPQSAPDAGPIGEPVAVTLDAPPDPKSWAWAVGWRHTARRLWVYRWRYLRNTFVVLSAWLVKACGWWGRGIARAARDFANYVDDRQGLAVADQAAGGVDGRANVDDWLRARSERHREVLDRRRVVRSRIGVPLLLVAAVIGLAAWLNAAAVVRAALAPATLTGWSVLGCWLVWYGRPKTAPFWPAFREPSPYPPVSNDTVTAALAATGITQIKDLIKGGHSPVDVIYRDDSAGGKVAETHVIPGVTTDMLMAKAVIVAGALKRPTAMVHLAQAPSGVPGHVEILVLDIDPGKTKPKPFAYLGKPVNVGGPCTIGYDPRNRPVRWALPGRNTIATGTPGAGKTAFLVGLGCLAAADVLGAMLVLFDFKGMGDYADLEPVCLDYCADPDPMETAARLVRFLHWLKRDIVRRRKVLTDLKRAGSPLLDNNAAALTDRLARTRKHNMPWLLVIIDEVHEGLADPVCGKEITQLLAEIMKIGRACGVHLVIASQRTDADSIPTSISSLPVVRVAFHQNGQQGNDQILGTGAYKRGIDATAFRRGAEGSAADDRGSCWFIGAEGGEPVKVRTTFVLPQVKRIIAQALTARQREGTLAGAALGLVQQEEPAPAFSALRDVRAVFVKEEIALHADVIFHRVNTRHPDRYKSWPALLGALKAEAPTWPTPNGTPTVNVTQVRPADAPEDAGTERTRKGIRREHLDAVITEINPTAGADTDSDDSEPSEARV